MRHLHRLYNSYPSGMATKNRPLMEVVSVLTFGADLSTILMMASCSPKIYPEFTITPSAQVAKVLEAEQ